jgi:holo-[acyl-carrier protein] synthase
MSIFGVGHDLVELQRMEAALDRHGLVFAQRILGPREMEVFLHRQGQNPRRAVACLASRFAAKEAVAKALGLGLRAPMGLHAGEVLNNDAGAPIWHSGHDLSLWLKERHLRVHLSLSDERHYASAYAVAECTAGV